MDEALAKRIELMRQRVELEKRLRFFRKADRIDLRVLLRNIENWKQVWPCCSRAREKVNLEMPRTARQEEAQRRLEEQKKEAEKAETELERPGPFWPSSNRSCRRLATATGQHHHSAQPAFRPGAVLIPISAGKARPSCRQPQLRQAALKKIAEAVGKRRNLVFNPDMGSTRRF